MTRRIERVLWVVTALFVALGAVAWRHDGSRPATVSGDARVGAAAGAHVSTPEAATALVSIAASVVARDPFRLDRRPSTVAFGGPPVAPTPPADPSRRPRISVSGIFGPPWQAVLEGIPGREGSVVARAGDVFGDLRVRAIRRDTVVVQGADTTWKLTVRHIW